MTRTILTAAALTSLALLSGCTAGASAGTTAWGGQGSFPGVYVSSAAAGYDAVISIEACPAGLCAVGESPDSVFRATCTRRDDRAACTLYGLTRPGGERYTGQADLTLSGDGDTLGYEGTAQVGNRAPGRVEVTLRRLGAREAGRIPAPPAPGVSSTW